jgi:hypothetical protein
MKVVLFYAALTVAFGGVAIALILSGHPWLSALALSAEVACVWLIGRREDE